MEVSGQRHALAALSPRNNPGTYWTRDCMGHKSVFDLFGDEKVFFAFEDSNSIPFSL
jgi:hypothetical protein